MTAEIKNGLIIDDKGNKRWYLNDYLHRIDGPAVEWADGTREWYLYGLLHRIDGSAIEWSYGDKQWWLYNHIYPEEEYNHLVSNLPLLYWNRFKEGLWL